MKTLMFLLARDTIIVQHTTKDHGMSLIVALLAIAAFIIVMRKFHKRDQKG